MYTKEFIINEISYYNDYDLDILKTKSEEELNIIFNEHCERYSIEVKAKDLVENYKDINFLMSSPDGYLNVGDFWIKHNKEIISIQTADSFSATVSADHLFETPSGWTHAGKLSKGDLILTKEGFRQIKYINKWDKLESVYDWEILHDAHRYWAGNGLSSHNTGKTYLTLNAVKQAQDIGYYIVYYDSENAVDRDLVEKFGIDSTKFRYEPCNTVQEFRSSVTALTDTLIAQQTKGLVIPKVMIILDSAGNLATQKEIDDAKNGSDKADMTRSKLLKSTFRILMTKLGIVKVPFIFTNHTYQTMDLFSQTVSGGGCLIPGSLILMADGTYKEIENINEGDFVQTLQGSKEIENVWTFEKPTYLVEFEDGTSLTCSSEHRFFIGNLNDDTLDDNNWVYAKDLSRNDFVSVYNTNVLTPLKVKNVTELNCTKVHDLTVADVQHYITDNGVINHNTGPEYAASIILFLGKAKLKEGTEQTGIIVSAKPNKNRFAKPTPIKFHISFNKGMNPYIGLEEYISWDNCGIQRGRFITEGQFDKLKEAERAECRKHIYMRDEKEVTVYFQPAETARKFAVAHLNDLVDLNQLFTPKVITQEVLQKLEPIVSARFKYGVDELDVESLDGVLGTNDEDENED